MENRNNNPIAEEIIHNNPTGYGLFAGIGDNFNSAAQAICELADDAISNLRANSDDPDLSMTIVVSFENLGDAVEIGVVDGGTGITNLDSALTIACRDGAQTPLNEHGFGLKHALASCDSSPSQQWSIRTRTKKDAAANQYREVTAPYSMGTSEEDQPMKVFFYPGAGGLPYPTGTAVTVRCPMAKFQTVKPDRKAAQSDFHHLVMYAIEELRYIYAGVLADTSITMKVLEVNGGTEKCHILKPLQPTWEEGTMKRLENVPYDLGGGQLTIHCRYGNILPTKSNAIYYSVSLHPSSPYRAPPKKFTKKSNASTESVAFLSAVWQVLIVSAFLLKYTVLVKDNQHLYAYLRRLFTCMINILLQVPPASSVELL